MGVFSKIKEIIKRIKTPKLSEGNNHRQNQNNNQLQFPYYITLPNGENFEVVSIQTKGDINHSNGEKTNLFIAKAFSYQNGDTIYFDSPKNIAFELQQGTSIDEVIMKKIGQYYAYEKNMPDNNKECMYLGKLSQDPYDLSTNNKSKTIENYINIEIVPQIVKEKQEQRERQMASYREREQRYQNEFVKKLKEETNNYVQNQNKIRSERIQKPYLIQNNSKYSGTNGEIYYDYDGVNISNGDILRLRKMNKVGKDENGTYVYTGYVSSTPNEHDVEFISRYENPKGTPICFATDKKIEEIIQSNNQNDLIALLRILSKSETDRGNNQYLNYIGKINADNTIDTEIKNTTVTIQNTFNKLHSDFYNEKMKEEKNESYEKQ